MVKADKHFTPDQVKLTGRLSEFRDALQDEIKEVENNGQNSTLLISGHSIEAEGSGFWYRFFVEYMPILPADTPCKLTIGTEQYDVTVISSSENEIILSSKNKLPANIGKAKLENGSTVLMERLIKCIEDNAEKNNPAGDRMFTDLIGRVYQVQKLFSYDEIHYTEDSNEEQKKAVKSAVENDITYIWGPPGTGKTTVIATIINELYRHDRTVLIVSHTNTAVDGAISKVEEENKYTEVYGSSYPMLRMGITTEKVPPEALLKSHIERLGKELFQQKETLENRQQVILAELEKIRTLLAKDNWLKNSNLPELQGISEIISQLERERSAREKQLFQFKADLDKVIQSHPEGKSLLKLEGNYQEKNTALEKVQKERTFYITRKEQTEHQRQTAEDEVKKHTVYDELTLKIKRLMSEQFYRDKIAEAEAAIKALESSLTALKEKKDALQASIYKYESKGSVAKFFAGKVAYEHDQNALSETNRNIETKTELLQQKGKLLEDYRKQLSDLRLLLEKRKAVTPTKTIGYWTDEGQRLRKTLGEIRNKLATLEEQEQKLSSEIAFIELTKKNNQGFFNSVNTLQGKINACQKTIDDTNKQMVQNQGTLSKLLDEECELCLPFHSFDNRDTNDVIRELTTMNDEVYEELHSVDIEEEKKRKEPLENESNQILAELKIIQNKLAELEKQAIMNARIVGTTLAQSYLSDALRERQFDTVILDEASMASILPYR